MAEQTIQTLAPDIVARYTLAGPGPNASLTISIYNGRNFEDYASASGTFSTRDDMRIRITEQLARMERRERRNYVDQENLIPPLLAIINSSTSSPEEKAEAERSLLQVRAQAAAYLSEADNLKTASINFNQSFSEVTNTLEQQVTVPPPTNVATVNPAPVVPVAPAETVVTNPVTGSGNDDSGAPQASAPGITPDSPAGTAGAGGSTPDAVDTGEVATPIFRPGPVTLPTIANYTFSDFSKASTQEVAAFSTPGKRLKNPLGEFNSYTYQLSLYVITPDAYSAFVAGGRTKIDVFNSVAEGREGGGAWLVAQSGGINNTNSKRAPGFEYDHGIDNLTINAVISSSENGGSPVNTTYGYSFDIIEPYGFSFISNLTRINAVIASYNGGSTNNPENPFKQFFILGIKFLGYGVAGVPANPSDVMSYNGGKAEPNYVTGAIDPLSQNGNLFEQYHDISVNSIKFKLDGRATTYRIEATSVGGKGAYSVKHGLINNITNVTAGNVAQAIDLLMVQLNKVQQDLVVAGTILHPNTFKVVWAPGTQPIIDAALISEADLQKFKWPGSGANKQEQVNAALEVRTQSASNTSINVPFSPQTPILSAINKIIAQSSFLENALNIVYTTALQAPEDRDAPAQIDNAQQTRVSWFSCTAEIEKMVWDTKVSDWAYDITYNIHSYQTPLVDSVYVGELNQIYPGPHKRYDYWHTGKNSEIIKYEQTFDNLFFNVALAGRGDLSASGVSTAPLLQTEQDRLGRAGLGMEAQNNYLTSLYSQDTFSTAIIDILGDPDYLFENPSLSENVIYDNVYTKGLTVNPNGGQVFIEIDFKEAVDYTNETGTLSINESIQFVKYPPSIANKIKGVSYQLTQVDSKFSKGAFTQQLTARLHSPFVRPPSAGERPADGNTNTTPPGTAPSITPPGTNRNTGTLPDPSFNVRPGISPPADTSNQTPATPVTRNGVADSDGSRRG